MSQYMTDLEVSLNEAEESKCRERGFSKIDVNLNKGAGGNQIFLWYKKEQGTPITRIQCSFTEEMSSGLIHAGYQKIDKNLNAGTDGNKINLWFFKTTTKYDVPIVDLHVTTDVSDEAEKFRHGWERLACNLNRGAGGKLIYLWVKRENPTFICDVTATDDFGSDADNFQAGYIRVDEDTNRGAGGNYVYIWYRQTTDATQALTDLQISISDEEYDSFQSQNYKIVNTNLNEGTGGNPIFLWYKKEASGTIKAISVITNTAAVGPFEKVGVTVIEKSLNTGNNGITEFLCFN